MQRHPAFLTHCKHNTYLVYLYIYYTNLLRDINTAILYIDDWHRQCSDQYSRGSVPCWTKCGAFPRSACSVPSIRRIGELIERASAVHAF